MSQQIWYFSITFPLIVHCSSFKWTKEHRGVLADSFVYELAFAVLALNLEGPKEIFTSFSATECSLLQSCYITAWMRSSHPHPESHKGGLSLAFLSCFVTPPAERAITEHTIPCLQTAVQTTWFPLQEYNRHSFVYCCLHLLYAPLWSIEIKWKPHAE